MTARTPRLLAAALGVTALLAAVASPARVEANFRVHTVAPGETLSHIADSAGTTLDALLELNAFPDPNNVAAGAVVVIPGGTSDIPIAATVASAPSAAPTARYTVTEGDTLSAIADHHGTTIEALRRLNDLGDGSFLAVGARLVVPAPKSEPVEVVRAEHTVRSGETLSAIADRYGVRPSTLAAFNNLNNPNFLRVGATLRIPARSLPTPPPAIVSAIRAGANAYDLDPYLLLGLSYMESGWQMDVVSSTGAVGMMQLMPETALWLTGDLLGRPFNWDASLADNTLLGAAYLDHLLWLANGDIALALASYYQGWASVTSIGNYDETDEYVEDVLALVARFRALGLTGLG